jgi:DNA-binding NarL/FixJ family response regulator
MRSINPSNTHASGDTIPGRIFILEDHPTMRLGIKHLLEENACWQVVGESDQVTEALEMVGELKPDLVIADLVLEGKGGLDFLKAALEHQPDLNVLIYSMHEEKYYAERVLTLGGRGYLMKSSDTQTLLLAVEQLLAGQVYLSQAMSRLVLDRLSGRPRKVQALTSPLQRLTDRELEILNWIGRAKTSQEISKLLGISLKTVETHRAHMRQKLGLNSRHELIQLAIRWVEHAL